jgi:hypothetical protein
MGVIMYACKTILYNLISRLSAIVWVEESDSETWDLGTFSRPFQDFGQDDPPLLSKTADDNRPAADEQ